MLRRLAHVTLFAIAAAGFVLMLQARSELAVVRTEYDELAAEFGELNIVDPDKFYVARINTEDPRDFAWRLYKPDQVGLSGAFDVSMAAGRSAGISVRRANRSSVCGFASTAGSASSSSTARARQRLGVAARSSPNFSKRTGKTCRSK